VNGVQLLHHAKTKLYTTAHYAYKYRNPYSVHLWYTPKWCTPYVHPCIALFIHIIHRYIINR